jgi:outer membrane protein
MLQKHLMFTVGVVAITACCSSKADAQNLVQPPVPSGFSPVPQESEALSVAAEGESLQDAWGIALSVDPSLEASRWQSSAAQRGLHATRAERLPSISASGSYSVFDNPLTILAPIPPVPGLLPGGATASVTATQREFFLGGVRATQPLYTAGRINAAIDAAGAEVTAAVSDEQRTELDVKLQVAAAYIGVLKARRLLQVANDSVTSLEDHARVVANQVKQGVGIRANQLAVEVALSNATQLRLRMRNLVTVAEAAYNRALQRPLDTPVQIQDLSQPTQAYDLNQATQQALGQRPEVGWLSAKVRSLRRLADSVDASRHPQIALEGGFSYVENKFFEHETFNNVAVLAEWNFWDAGRKRHRTAQLDQSAEALLRKRTEIESLIALQVKTSWHDLDSAEQQVDVSQRGLESADLNLQVSRNRYQQGVGTNTEVLDAQTLRTESYGNYFNSLYESVLAEMQLRRAIGNL